MPPACQRWFELPSSSSLSSSSLFLFSFAPFDLWFIMSEHALALSHPSFLPLLSLSLSLHYPHFLLLSNLHSSFICRLVLIHSLAHSVSGRTWPGVPDADVNPPLSERHHNPDTVDSSRFDSTCVLLLWLFKCRAFRQMRISLSLTVQKY